MHAPRSLAGLWRWLWRWRAAGIVLRQLGNVLKLLLQEVHRLGVAHILLPAQQAERAPVVMMSLHLWLCIAVADRSRASRAASVQRAGVAIRAEGVTVRTLLHGVTVNPPLINSATPCIEFVTTTDGHGCARANVRVEHWPVRSARGLPAMRAVGKGMGPHRWPGVSVLAPRSCAMADAPSHSCCRKSSTAVPARHTRKWRSPLGCALSVRTRDDATAH